MKDQKKRTITTHNFVDRKMPKIYQDSYGLHHRYRPGMRIPDYAILLKYGTVYYKYDKDGVPKVIPRHLVHPKAFAMLVGEWPYMQVNV